MNKSNLILDVELYDFNDKEECKAFVRTRDGLKIEDFKVRRGLGKGIQVYMPDWMHTSWAYPELEWSTVRKAISDKFKEHLGEKGAGARRKKGMKAKARGKASKDLEVDFYSRQTFDEYLVNVHVERTDSWINGFKLTYNTVNKKVRISERNKAALEKVEREHLDIHTLYQNIRDEFKSTVLQEKVDKFDSGIECFFTKSRSAVSYMLDVTLPGRDNSIKGFRFYDSGDDIKITPPSWMGKWSNKTISWPTLCAEIKTCYYKQRIPEKAILKRPENKAFEKRRPKPRTGKPKAPAAPQREAAETSLMVPTQLPSIITVPNSTNSLAGLEALERSPSALEAEGKAGVDIYNDYGRVKNSARSPWRFYPQTVLRLDKNEKNNDSKLYRVALALLKGSDGGIGSTELGILKAVEDFRYLTNSMLLDLLGIGYIKSDWDRKRFQKKLTNTINRMDGLNLVRLSRFSRMDEDGERLDSTESNLRIISLGNSGHVLLQESGCPSRFSHFEVYREGGYVKRVLSANQWLIWWLTQYGKQIGRNYRIGDIVFQKNGGFKGVRIFASFNLNGKTFIGEPVRRGEEFESGESLEELRDKLQRFNALLANPAEVYRRENRFKDNKANLMGESILVFVCEDEEHSREVYESLKDLIEDEGGREVWFTTDLGVFNYDYDGPRFQRATPNGLEPVDLEGFLAA